MRPRFPSLLAALSFLTVLTVLSVLSASALAQQPAPGAAGAAQGAPTAGPRTDDGWQPVTTQMVQAGEGFEANKLVGAAYGFIWLVVAFFVFTIWRRADGIDKEIVALRAKISAKQKQGGK